MKTTIEIADPLFKEARKLAARQGVTLRTLVERGLDHVLRETKTAVPFKLKNGTFKGEGLQAEFRDASWDKIRDATYEDHGA